MRIKSVVSAKIVQLVSGKIEHSCDNPVFTFYDNIIVSPSSASWLDIHYSTISLGCNTHGMINDVIYDPEWFAKAVTNKALARMLC
jgi:hypothetical protein